MSPTILFSQDYPDCVVLEIEDDEQILGLPNFCTDITNYIPDPTNGYENSPIRTLKISLHFFRKSDGTGIYQPEGIDTIHQFFDWLKDHYHNMHPPTLPVSPPAQEIGESRISFELMGIYFHDDDYVYDFPLDFYNSYPYDHYGINKESEINVFFFRQSNYTSGAGVAGPGWVNLRNENYDSWASSQLLAHEFGHFMGLFHTGRCQGSLCVDDDLDDTYTPDCNLDWKECDALLNPVCDCCSGSGISNNTMGYNKCRSYFSPKQMGIMHRELLHNNAKSKFCTFSDYNPLNSITINEDESDL